MKFVNKAVARDHEHRHKLGIVVLLMSLVLVASSCSTRDEAATNDPGITDTEIKVGGTFPFSGPATALGTVGKSATAYFAYINAQGGVKMGDGKTRKVTYITKDDAYTPQKSVDGVHQLIEQDQVFGLFASVGTATNLATWDYVNAQKVPDVFIASGASTFGADPVAHPWTLGFQLPYATEATIYTKYLQSTKPNAKVAILHQNDDYGKEYANNFKKGIAGTGITVVATQTYETTDPTVDSQVTNLAQSKADVFLNITTPKFSTQSIRKMAELGWKPVHLLNSPSASIAAVLKPAGLAQSEGIFSVAAFKDPSDTRWENDQGLKDYKARLGQYGPGIEPTDLLAEAGWSLAENFVKTLEKTKHPTRQAFMDAVRDLKAVELSLLLPGIKIGTSATDSFPIESAQIQQFVNGKFQLVGDVISYEGSTSTLLKAS